ncbi:MAG TPA: 2-C-methyl-D-erythritol 4-phosphate cytidylyltransferase [Ferruginibacter sp.]|nr:2-C-methyl-D-erythritol 4-phosphate cytidylyltransferase [Bacteroidota bacterium]MBS1925903.1 2-C-methyl-D-erythritol 4-phosphate cytidylyltransferase [Bacteroidota bacterium]HMT95443.1 2-C-methyl-D-erythritol 4-phosphate cytidylyltransferase [Ferruginibacter sp.]HMU25549.1 2-C-methyl-D-erythritol 4-phosphate cytidylyltransferase [Ferruginibacter sp.]HRD42849.1 2-C-methyl-D-erythritol 4-phosphate cytidylyltransferase [Ferruginibacter sp.]
MKKYAIIVAGGKGSRMNSALPKQFMHINNKPVLYYSINSFYRAFEDMQIILVLPEDYIASGQEVIDAWFDYDRIKICVGGDTRFQSVKNGLQFVEEEGIVFVHDAVRCLVSENLIQKCYETALEQGSAIPVIPCKDSLRLIKEDHSNEALDRGSIRIVQTPQAFHSKILLPAFTIDFKEKFTDEASVVESYGMKLFLVEGEENNIKITHPVDLALARQLLES